MPLETIDAPPIQDIGSPSDPFNAPLSAPIGEIAGDTLSTFRKSLDAARKADEKKPEPELEKSVEKVEDKPVDTKPEPKPESKAEAAKPAEEKKPDAKDPNYGKPKVRYSELPPEQREYLLASEERRLTKLREIEAERDELKGKLTPLETELAELREKAKQGDELSGKYQKLNETYEETQKRLMAHDVYQTDEYKQSVEQPWLKSVIGEIKDGIPLGGLNLLAAQNPGFDPLAARGVIESGDEAGLEILLKKLPGERARARLNALYDQGRALLDKHGQYAAKSADALKEINERKTDAERKAMDAHRGEVEKYRAQIVAANTKRFPFLDPAGKDLPPELKTAIEAAEVKIRDFDFGKLNPAQQAEFIENAHKGPLAVNFLDGYAAHLSGLLQAKDAELKTLTDKNAELEKRLGNKADTSLTPGRNGDAPRGVPKAAAPANAMEAFRQTKQQLLGR